VSRLGKLLERLVAGGRDANFAFGELRYILIRLGFEERIHGSHHVFRRSDIPEHVVLQPDGKDAKGYQVRQVRNLILKYPLGGEHDGQV
jgi:predicted RNA binding protein YcfA (HicA-like mRNA interferase family)